MPKADQVKEIREIIRELRKQYTEEEVEQIIRELENEDDDGFEISYDPRFTGKW